MGEPALRITTDVFDDASDGTLVIASDLSLKYINQSFAVMFGLPTRKLRKAGHLSELLEPPSITELTQWLRTLGAGRAQCHEMEVRSIGGVSVSALVMAQPVGNDNTDWLVSFRDISVEVRLHEKYREQLEHVKRQNHSLEMFAFILLCSIIGSSYLAIKFSVETIPPLLASSVRCFVPGLFVSLVFLFRGDPLSWTDWREGGVLSLARRAIPQGALTWAALQIPSGISSLIVSTIPIWVVFLEGFGGKKASNPVARYGAIIGLFGLTLIAVDSSRGNLAWFPLLVLVTAMILNAAGMCWSSARPGQAVRVVGPELAVGGIILFVLSLFSGELSTFSIGQVSEKSMLALVFLTVFASGLAPVALAWAMTVKDASHATSFMFYVPIISLALGCTVGKEQLHTLSIIACVFLLLSVYLIRKRRLP